jgi:ubiquinone/menaquinone biosynthesis C-methylase UbiE
MAFDYNDYDDIAFIYDRVTDVTCYERWTDFAIKLIRKKNPKAKTVLDLACGTGAGSIPLAKKGFKVTGMDLSKGMVNYARKKAKKLKVKADFVEGDMALFDFRKKFDAATSFCDSVNHLLSEAGVLAAFQNTFSALKEGGVFVFDMSHPNYIKKGYSFENDGEDFGDAAFIWENYSSKDHWQIDLTVFRRQKNKSYRKVKESVMMRAYPEKTVFKLLKEAGFKKVRSFDETRMRKPHAKTERIFYLAIK